MHVGLQVLASIFRELDMFVLTAVMQYIDGSTVAGCSTATIAIYNCTTKAETLVDIPLIGAPVPTLWVSAGAVRHTIENHNCQWFIADHCADQIALSGNIVVLGVSK